MDIYGYIEKQKKDLYIDNIEERSLDLKDQCPFRFIPKRVVGVRYSSKEFRNSQLDVYNLRLVKALSGKFRL
jgi:hypothetical protein